MTWNHNCHEGKTNPQLRDFKEGLQAYVLSFQCAFQVWESYASCGQLDAAMLCCRLCMDG
jgi:hypothetical protein